LGKEIEKLRKELRQLAQKFKLAQKRFFTPQVKMHLLPGAIRPTRGTKEASGYDLSILSIRKFGEMDPTTPHLRTLVFDFQNPPQDLLDRKKVAKGAGKESSWVYLLDPGEVIFVTFGIILESPEKLHVIVASRSGTQPKHKIEVWNSPNWIDRDFRGEFGAWLRNDSESVLRISMGMRLVQIIFTWSPTPDFVVVDEVENLSITERGANGTGSTGIFHGEQGRLFSDDKPSSRKTRKKHKPKPRV